MNAEAGTEQKDAQEGKERDLSGASALDVHLDSRNVKRFGKSRLGVVRSELPWLVFLCISSPAQAHENL